MTIETYPINSKGDWLALRRRDATATDIPALFGIHPYRTPLQVYVSKTSEGGDQRDTKAMRRGRILQPAVAEAVREERPDWTITEANTYFRDPDKRIGATPDYFVSRPNHGSIGMGVLEAKTANQRAFEESWANGPPTAYVMQTLIQMMLCNVSWGVVACLVTSPDFPLYIYDIDRHPAAEQAIISKVDEFWRMVEGGAYYPTVDFTKDVEYIERLFPVADPGSVIDLDGDNELPEMLADRASCQQNITVLQHHKDEIDARIKDKLGDFETGLCNGYKITWKTQNRKEAIIPALSYRVLKITSPKETI